MANAQEKLFHTPEEQWARQFASFLDPSKAMTVRCQLDLMTDFLSEFDLRVPPLNRDQLYSLEKTGYENPGLRLGPTLLLGDVTLRRNVVTPRANSSMSKLIGDRAKLWVQGDEGLTAAPLGREPSTLNRLWQEPGLWAMSHSDWVYRSKRNKDDPPRNALYAWCHKGPDTKLYNRLGFMGALVAHGDAVQVGSRAVWTFPFMEVNDPPRDFDFTTPGSNWQRLNYILTPESRILNQLFHLVINKSGTRENRKEGKNEDVVEPVNEVRCELTRGHGAEVKSVAGVTRSDSGHFIRLAHWRADIELPEWTIPQGVSGLQYSAP